MHPQTDSMVTDESTSVEQLIEQMTNLPSPPVVVSRTLQIIAGDNESVQSLAETIETDHALTAKLLRIANSAFYGMAQEIFTVRDAILIIGFDAVRSVAISAAAVTGVWVDDELFNMERFWKHSLSCGLFAEFIAKKIHYPTPEVVFTLGVLHDIGRVVIIQSLSQRYRDVISLMKEQHTYLWKAEREVLGFHHGEVGARLAENWHFPPAYSNAIRFHHEPEKVANQNELTYVLSLADAMSHHVFSYDCKERLTQPLYRGLWEPLKLNESDVRMLLKHEETIQERTEVFLEISSMSKYKS